MITLLPIIVCALLLDHVYGEPRRFHPLVGFGALASRLERLSNRHQTSSASTLVLKGALSVLILVLPLMILVYWASLYLGPWLEWTLSSVVLYWAIGYQSLNLHVERVAQALNSNDLAEARNRLSMIVSRETNELSEDQIVRASIETTLENGSDAIFAPIFWFCIFGAPAVVMYRLVNTLDAMWGYKNDRFIHFGYAAARLDDVLNFIPARLVALSYALLGRFQLALQCWRTQAALLDSPNAGPVMTAGAGSLDVQLGGPSRYHGQPSDKPYFGSNTPVERADIVRALRLISATVVLWCLVIAGVSLVCYFL